MRYLRQSTAATVIIGSFVDKTTALPITTLTDQSANGRLVKNGTGGAIAVASWAHDAQGHYLVGLSTSHTDTIGKVRLEFYLSSTYLPVWEDFTVLSAAVYDSLFGTVAISTYAGGAVASVAAAVAIDLTQLLSAPRNVDAVADNAMTVGDGFWAAIAQAWGKWAKVSTNLAVKTPAGTTTTRNLTLDDPTSPTSRS